MKRNRRIAVLLILSVCMALSACGGAGDDGYITPRVIAEEITDLSRNMNIIQQPAAFFLKSPKGVPGPAYESIEKIYTSGAEAYMKLLTEVYGFELFYEDPGYVYNEYYFIHPDSPKVRGERGEGYDVYVKHVYASSYTVTRDWMDVELDGAYYSFGDLGFRYESEKERQAINGRYAADAFEYNGKRYYNASDGELKVRSGLKREMTYTYTKPFANQFYGFIGKKGASTYAVNGTEPEEGYSLIADYTDFHSSSTDLLIVYDDDGKRLVTITWEHEALQVGKVYTLYDFFADNLWRFEFEYDEYTNTENNALALTVRPLVLDREGTEESVVYFYGEFEHSEKGITTIEGLVAATFCREENSEKYSSESDSSSGGGSLGVPDSGETYIPEHSKLDCLTCRGDGDCNSCGGSGYDYYGGYRTTCNTCHGNGNCRSCGGSGKR